MSYLVHSAGERRDMLGTLGLTDTAQLFETVPEALRGRCLRLPLPLGEQELVAEVEALAACNRPLANYDSFLGAGAYQRYIPAIVKATIARPEFYTAYTPYQAEASQGTLQSIFEFQSMICALTGLDVANASLYDGATAAAEAMLLAVAHTGRHRVAASAALPLETLSVLDSFAAGRGVVIDRIDSVIGCTDSSHAEWALTADHAAFLFAQPTAAGVIEAIEPLVEVAHRVGALAVACVDPIACTVLLAPGEAGCDIAVGDGQPLGIPLSFGGPYLGFIAVREELMRRLPGRLVGMTTDNAGRRGFALTLQTREQHIRRERATSNICTNHALMALAATVYMGYMGAVGMAAVAETSAVRAHSLGARLIEIDGFELAYPHSPFLWEFVLRCPGRAVDFAAALRVKGIIAGWPLTACGSDILVCCTELSSPAAIDRYVAAAASLVTTPTSGVSTTSAWRAT